MLGSIWSRLIVLLTLLGALLTLASWLDRQARLVLFVIIGLLIVQALPVYLVHLASLAWHRRRALESIACIGGRVTARLAAEPDSILELNLADTNVAGLKWDSLYALSQLEALNLANTSMTNDQLEYLSRLPALRSLELDGTQITDAGLAVLGGFPRLSFVSLTGTLITEDGLERLFYARPSLEVEAEHLPPLDHLDPLKDVAHDAQV